MRHLILSGGGDYEQSKKTHKLFLSFVKGRVLYIPLAMAPHERSFEECLTWIKKAIGEVELCKSLNNINLSKYGGVYIGGGNTYHLLKIVKETGFDLKLKEYYLQGGVIYGGSAGAIILGKHIGLSGDENIGLDDLNGLDLVDGYSIACHYDGDDSEITNFVKEIGKVLALPEGDGVHVSEGIEFIGDVKIFE